MAQENILIIEDDKNISKLIKYNLEKSGFNCSSVITGEDGFEVLDKEQIDLILLDIMLPKMDGFEFCKILKQNEKLSKIPVIMLTAKGEEIDKVLGFELGVDDYIVKPFSPRELSLRIKAVLSRGNLKEDIMDILKHDKLKLDISRHKVTFDKKEIELTLMEFKLLQILMQRKGRVQSRDRLLNDVWDIAADVTTRTVDTHIKRLRQKIGKAGRYIKTIRGIGYKFNEE